MIDLINRIGRHNIALMILNLVAMTLSLMAGVVALALWCAFWAGYNWGRRVERGIAEENALSLSSPEAQS